MPRKPGRTVETTVTLLEMTTPPAQHVPPPANLKLALMLAERPPVHFYRYLYDIIGRDMGRDAPAGGRFCPGKRGGVKPTSPSNGMECLARSHFGVSPAGQFGVIPIATPLPYISMHVV